MTGTQIAIPAKAYTVVGNVEHGVISLPLSQ